MFHHHLKESFVTPKNLREPCVSSGTTEASRIPGSRDPSARLWKRTKSAGWFSPCLYMAQSKIHWLTVALNTYIAQSYVVYHKQNIDR